nr:AraC family transcriptional regulator [Sedimentibacter sp.]
MNKFRGRFNINSIFFKIFSILIIITILILLFLSYFLNSIIINNQEDEINQNNFSHLQQFSDSLDLTLSIVSQSMSQCLWDKDIISYLVNPLIIDYQRTARIMRTLNNNVSGNKLVANAYLFSSLSNEIYDSNNNIISRDVPSIKKILDDYLSLNLNKQLISKGNTSVFIKNYNSKLFIFVDVITSKRIGTLIYEINIYEIYKLLATNFGDKTIYVFDENGSPIINFYDDNKILDFNNDSDFIKYNNKNNSNNAKYYLITSKNNGWKYVSSINEPKSILNWKKAIELLFPIILCLFAFGVVFPIFISYVIYHPIRNLVRTVAVSADDEKITSKKILFKNEFDFIGQSYLNVVDKYKEMKCHIKDFSKSILEKLFENIMLGEYLDDEYINYTLDGIDNPVKSNNKYTVVLLKTILPKNYSEEQENPYLLQLNNIISQVCQRTESSIFPVIIEKDLIAIVISSAPDYSDIELKKVINNISNFIEQYTQNLQNKFLIGRGKIYNNIKDLKYSYLESKRELDCQLNYYDNKNNVSSSINDNYYNERVEQIIKESVDGHKKEAEDILKRVLKEISDKDSDINKARELYNTINNKMIEKVVTFNINQEDIINLDRQQISDKLLSSISIEEIEKHTFNFCKAAIKVIYAYGRKAKYAYINEAKNYIALNYSNESLSLNDVSQSVGISHSYLSELFKEITNQNFLSYLNLYRIEQSKFLLSNTDILIKDIGIKCGFNSTQNFIRVFKKYAHLTPLQYRKKNQIIK